jgi:hypothetical protein
MLLDLLPTLDVRRQERLSAVQRTPVIVNEASRHAVGPVSKHQEQCRSGLFEVKGLLPWWISHRRTQSGQAAKTDTTTHLHNKATKVAEINRG